MRCPTGGVLLRCGFALASGYKFHLNKGRMLLCALYGQCLGQPQVVSATQKANLRVLEDVHWVLHVDRERKAFRIQRRGFPLLLHAFARMASGVAI